MRQSETHRIGIMASQSPLEIGWFIANAESFDQAIARYEEHRAAWDRQREAFA